MPALKFLPAIKLQQWQKILVGLFLGVGLGLCLSQENWSVAQYSTSVLSFLKPIGNLFINAIKMMVVPVVFVSIVCGVISMGDAKTMGRIGVKTIGIFFITMLTAAALGVFSASFFEPGLHINTSLLSHQTLGAIDTQTATSVGQLLSNIIPSNPVAAFASANILQVVVFALILGICINLAGEKGQLVKSFFESLSSVIMYIPKLVMMFAPYGVFALMAVVTTEFGFDVLKDLFTALVAVYVACLLQALLVYSSILISFKLSPIAFFKGMLEAITFAISTTSSAATLPYTKHCAEKNLGVPASFTNFVVPIGSTMNMNGLSVYLGVTAIFAANLFNIPLNLMDIVLIVTIASISSMGAGSIPGSALLVMSLVLSVMGLPAEGIALVIALFSGVDRIIDMITTPLNITGDALASTIIAKTEKSLDEAVYTNKTKTPYHIAENE